MSQQAVETTGRTAPAMGRNTALRTFRSLAVNTAAVIIVLAAAAGALEAQTKLTQNVNVVNTPAVTVSGAPAVHVDSLPVNHCRPVSGARNNREHQNQSSPRDVGFFARKVSSVGTDEAY